MNDDVIILGGIETFCERFSISQKEYYESLLQGLKPVYRFNVWNCDYHGEDELVYCGEKLVIYRTFQKGEKTEIYTLRKAGRK